MCFRYLYILILLLACISLHAQNLFVEITNIRNNDGLIRLGVFTCNETFRKEMPYKEFSFAKDSLGGGAMQVTITTLPPGTYGIALLDDENSNGKLDYHLLLPREGVGFSGYEHHRVSQPSFDRFSFLLEKQKTIRVTIKVNYYR